MNPNDPLAALLHSRKFWIAVVAVIQSLVFAGWPNFPQDVWQAIDALAVVLIATIAYEDAAAKGAEAAARFAAAIRRGDRPDDAPR